MAGDAPRVKNGNHAHFAESRICCAGCRPTSTRPSPPGSPTATAATPGSRRDLIQALAEAGRPLTVDEIVERAPRQRPSSVYRNLAVFEAEGVVRRMAGVGDLARFELTEALVGHHHHLACQVVRRHDRRASPPRARGRARPGADPARPREGFALSSHVLDAVGVCQACSDGARWHPTCNERLRATDDVRMSDGRHRRDFFAILSLIAWARTLVTIVLAVVLHRRNPDSPPG